MALPEPALFFVYFTFLLRGLHNQPLWLCWPMHLFTFLDVSTPLFAFSCVFVYFAYTYEPPSVLFWPIHLFAFVGVCAQLFLRNCACALFSFGRPPGGRNLWRTHPQNNLPERRPPRPITRWAIACECAGLAQAIFTWLTKDFFFLACS